MRKVGNGKLEAVTNITEAWAEIADTLAQLKAGLISEGKAHEVFNGSGKLIKAVVAQCEYAKLRKEKPNLPHAA